MFHLFDRVYLEHESKLDLRKDRIVMSATTGHPLGEELDPYFKSKLIHHEIKFENFFPGKFLELVAELKAADKKVIIYCDSLSLQKLMAAWLCSVIPKMDFKLFSMLMYAQDVRERSLASRNFQGIGPVSDLPVSDKLMRELFYTYRDSKGAIKDLSAFIDQNWESVSMEYRIGHYLKTQDTKYLRATVSQFVNRYFSNIVSETQRFMMSNIFSKQQMRAGNYSLGALESRPHNPLEVISGYPMLTKSKCAAEKNTLCHLSNEELEQLNKDLQKFSIDMVGMTEELIKDVFDCFYMVNKSAQALDVSDINTFLKAIRTDRSDYSIISNDDLGNINNVTLGAILNLHPKELAALTFAKA